MDNGHKLQSLGGSAFLKQIHGQQTGTPPHCDMDVEKALHDALRGWIAQGVNKSAHDCRESGLAVALAELHDGWWNSIARALAWGSEKEVSLIRRKPTATGFLISADSPCQLDQAYTICRPTSHR